MPTVGARLITAAGVAYFVLLAWAIGNSTYDVWGLLIVLPPIGVLGTMFVRFTFRDDLSDLRVILYWGLAVKLLGAALRYWVGFEAYGGGIDAARYHRFAAVAASDVWNGTLSLFNIFPSGIGTPKMEGTTTLVYVFTGTSQMAGFVTFSFLAFIGTAYFIKAACIAVPGLARRRYAILGVIAPSLVYWPSSIGKDAVMLFLLGIATYGLARLTTTTAFAGPFLATLLGLSGTALIRPHLAGIWLAGTFPALLVTLIRGRGPSEGARRALSRAAMLPVLLIAVIGMAVMASVTVDYLNPDPDDPTSDPSLTSIVDETARRTSQAGSAFEPPSISSRVGWPYASIRTLIRPLPTEVQGAAQLFTSAEMMVFLGLLVLSWRRVINLPRLLLRNPYVAFAMTTLFLLGLAFSSFANLAVLTRQKSIAIPFMILIVCLPEYPQRHHGLRGEQPLVTRRPQLVAQNSSTSPSASAQLDSGGAPASQTARQVSIGPPPGNGSVADDIWDSPSRIT
jgi:hypothetical protein